MRYKVVATGEFTQFTPAHGRFITKVGEGSSLRVAAKNAVDRLLTDERIKRLKAKLPLKIVIQDGGKD